MSSSPSQDSPEPRGLLYILFSAFGFLLGWISSRSHSRGQQHKSSMHADDETQPQDSRISANINVRSELYTPESVERQRQENENRNYSLQRWLVIGTWGAFIAAAIYAGISLKIWHEMQTQTCIQREASISAERAWVGLDMPPQVEVDSLKQKQFAAKITLAIKNYGKGPALNVNAQSTLAMHGHVLEQLEADCNLLFTQVGLKPSKPVSFSPNFPQGLQWGHDIFTNQPTYHTITTGGESSSVIGQEVFVVGCIVYRDQFLRPHWTKFSYSTGPYVQDAVKDPASFKHLYISNANNYTDDAEKKPGCPVTEP